MSVGLETSVPAWTSSLRRFVTRPPAVERCEICSEELADGHEHLVESATGRLLCACTSCCVLFGYQADAKFRRVPKPIDKLANAGVSDQAWRMLDIPVGLAFLFRRSSTGKVVAMYPSPGGATEAAIDDGDWAQIVSENQTLRELEDDVQALIVNRIDGARNAYRVPVDECYKLIGLIRTNWRGFSGGEEVWQQIRRYFTSLDERAATAGRRRQRTAR